MDELNAEYQKLAQQAQAWIEAVTGKTFPDGDFIDNLTDGVMLCRLMRKLLPGCVKSINKSKMPFARRENISSYLKAARAFGQIEFELFETEDLASKRNVKQVISSLHSLGRTAQAKRPDLEHTLGTKVVQKSKRVKPKVEKWKSETDPGGRTFWRCETLGLTCWKKPSEDELALANMKHWVEMANPDGQRYLKNKKTGELRWADDNEGRGDGAASAAAPPPTAAAPPPVPTGGSSTSSNGAAAGAAAGAGGDAGAGSSGTPAAADKGGDGASGDKDSGGDKGGSGGTADDATADPDALHPDWEEVEADGGVYYRHKTTYETQWEKPTVGGASAGGGGEDGAAAAADGMDPEWEAVTMDDGSVYYQHKEHTFITSWEMPAPLPDGWVMKTTEDAAYYENEATGESVWERPSA